MTRQTERNGRIAVYLSKGERGAPLVMLGADAKAHKPRSLLTCIPLTAYEARQVALALVDAADKVDHG